MSERELQDWIVAAARLLSWRVAHYRPAWTKSGWWTPVSYDGQGFPDLVLCRERVVFAEIKVGRNKVSPEQTAWLEALREAGVAAHVWTDEDGCSGVVENALRSDAV